MAALTYALNGWPVTRSLHLFDNVKLKAEWYDIKKSLTKSLRNIDPNVLLGGRLDYTVTYTQGWPLYELANIDFEGFYIDERIASDRLEKGETKSGSVDLSGLIAGNADVTISFASSPGMWSEVQFDIWVTLGFSEPPATEPVEPFDLIEWIKENPLLAGAIGFGALYFLFSKTGKTIVLRERND